MFCDKKKTSIIFYLLAIQTTSSSSFFFGNITKIKDRALNKIEDTVLMSIETHLTSIEKSLDELLIKVNEEKESYNSYMNYDGPLDYSGILECDIRRLGRMAISLFKKSEEAELIQRQNKLMKLVKSIKFQKSDLKYSDEFLNLKMLIFDFPDERHIYFSIIEVLESLKINEECKINVIFTKIWSLIQLEKDIKNYMEEFVKYYNLIHIYTKNLHEYTEESPEYQSNFFDFFVTLPKIEEVHKRILDLYKRKNDLIENVVYKGFKLVIQGYKELSQLQKLYVFDYYNYLKIKIPAIVYIIKDLIKLSSILDKVCSKKIRSTNIEKKFILKMCYDILLKYVVESLTKALQDCYKYFGFRGDITSDNIYYKKRSLLNCISNLMIKIYSNITEYSLTSEKVQLTENNDLELINLTNSSVNSFLKYLKITSYIVNSEIIASAQKLFRNLTEQQLKHNIRCIQKDKNSFLIFSPQEKEYYRIISLESMIISIRVRALINTCKDLIKYGHDLMQNLSSTDFNFFKTQFNSFSEEINRLLNDLLVFDLNDF